MTNVFTDLNATTVAPTVNSTTSVQVYTPTRSTSGTTTTTAAVQALTKKTLIFKSKDTFTSDLNDPSSAAYKNRSTLITTTVSICLSETNCLVCVFK